MQNDHMKVNWTRHDDHLVVRTKRNLTSYVNLWGKHDKLRIYADFKVEDPTTGNPKVSVD